MLSSTVCILTLLATDFSNDFDDVFFHNVEMNTGQYIE